MSDHSHPNPKRATSRRSNQPQRPPPAARASQGPAPQEEEWVTLGQIVGAFGVRGDLKVVPQTDIPSRFAQLQEVYLGAEHHLYHIASVRPYKGELLLLHLDGIEDANHAEALRGLTLDIPLARIAPLPPDQYYIHDLLGLRVETSGGQVLGSIKDILPTGGHDVYVVQEQGSQRQVLVPAVKAMVKRIDIAAGVIILDPIPGLFDERFEEAP